jgi:translation initiation factor IF-1
VDGLVVSQNQDFADMMNSLFTRLVPGDIVLIRGGEYSLTKSIRNTNRNGITLLGESGTVFKATSGNTDGMLWIYSGGGGLNPSNCVVEGITFDANYNTVISPTVGIGGSYNTVQNCTFLNTMQYGLLAWRAHNFKFIYNYVEQAQYGISTGADENEWCSDGLISNNFITDSSDCAIKLRWVTDTLVYNNTIEVVKTNCKGIRYYHADGPTVNTTVTHNIIRGDPSAGLTSGVWVDYDSRALSSGSYIADNVVNGCYYGVHNDWGRVSIVDNVVINAHVPIYNSNDDAIISDNIIS